MRSELTHTLFGLSSRHEISVLTEHNGLRQQTCSGINAGRRRSRSRRCLGAVAGDAAGTRLGGEEKLAS